MHIAKPLKNVPSAIFEKASDKEGEEEEGGIEEGGGWEVQEVGHS